MASADNIRAEIKKRIEDAFLSEGKTIPVIITTYPVTEQGNEALEKEAKAKGDNGIIYIGRAPRNYGERKGNIYNVDDPYLILMYTNNTNDDSSIHEIFETTRRCLYKFMKLESDDIRDIGGYKSTLYMAWILAKWQNIYYGQ